jgi:hypothetical protein
MVVLDSVFLAYLEDPNLMDPTQIHEEMNKIVKNVNFLDIIDQEVTRMFRLNGEGCEGHDHHHDTVPTGESKL